MQFKALVLAIALSMAGALQAHAAVVLPPGSNVSISIQGLEVDGITYDVTFARIGDPTFDGNISGAQNALNAIMAALNASPAAYVSVPGVGSFDGVFVTYGPSQSLLATSFGSAGNWQQIGGGGGAVAHFTRSEAVPEPMTIALLGVGMIGLGIARRRCAPAVA